MSKQAIRFVVATCLVAGVSASAAAGPYDGYGVTPPPATALLYSSRGGSPLWDYCQGRADATLLPPDPRSLVKPGVNAGKAVLFNAFWRDCHFDPVAVQEAGPPKTCGELRSAVWRGGVTMQTGTTKPGALFAGDDPTTADSLYGTSTFTASQFNKLWIIWGGFLLRPDNFDDLVAERYGSGFGPARNPYPKPGEDPNKTNGGTGKLPELFTQLRNPDGKWSGRIGVTCHGCHSGVVGKPADGPGLGLAYGGGSSLADLNLFLRDMLPLGYSASLATLANLNRTRGTNNASDINLAFLFPETALSIDVLLGVITSGSTAGMDTPAWWNLGHRPLKFVDGVFPADAPRVDMVFYTPFLGLFGSVGGPLSDSGQKWMREHGPDANQWLEQLKAPKYPYAVSTALAEQGSQLFHTLDLWGPGRNNPVPRPAGGNGSCASCHGAYAPRYVNDPAYLDTPALEGIASYITPKSIIRTDPVRVDTNNESVQIAGASNFFGYPQTAGTPNDCGPQNRSDLRGSREPGYLAQPLYGVWATAPYFHNGSVPNVWEVLKPSDRKPIWRRVSKPARWDQTGRVIMGFDTDLARAYDRTKLGWKYDVIPCRPRTLFDPGVTPYIDCDPRNEDADPLAQQLLAVLYDNLILTWNILYPPLITNTQMEERKIYNTHMYAQGNEGHELSQVLTDTERLAIIEYLKTL